MASKNSKGGIIIDPTKNTKYPVILSDGLQGKASQETFTGIRYNYKPDLSSELAPSQAYLKPSAKDGSYNLGFVDHGEKYTYNGVRTSGEGQYVLVFDPAKKAFVLHRVDSLFHMETARLPKRTNAESLAAEFPRLEVKDTVTTAKKPQETISQAQQQQSPLDDVAAAASTGKKNAPAKAKPKSKPPQTAPKNKEPRPPRRKASEQNNGFLTLPDPAAAKEALPPPPPEPPRVNTSMDKKKRAEDSEEEDDDDDDDGGLQVEYPDTGPPPPWGSFGSHRAPPIPQISRPFSDFVRDYQEEADDLDAEAEPEFENVYDAFTTNGGEKLVQPSSGGDQADWGGDADLEAELDAELERAMEDDLASESSVSEED